MTEKSEQGARAARDGRTGAESQWARVRLLNDGSAEANEALAFLFNAASGAEGCITSSGARWIIARMAE